MVPCLVQSGEGLVQGVKGPVDVLTGLPQRLGGLIVDVIPLAGQFCRQTGDLLQRAGDGLHVARQIQRGEGELKGLLKLSGGNQPCHVGDILLYVVQLLRHGLAVGADDLELVPDAGDGVLQRANGLSQAAVRLTGQLFQLAQQGVCLIQRLLELVARLLAELVQIVPQAVQAAADGGGVLVELVGHGLEVVPALRPGGVGAVLDGGQGVVDGLGVVHTPGDHVIELVGEVLQLVKEGGEAVGKLLGGGGTIGEAGVGLKLARDASHVLTALDGSGVGAVGDLPRLKAHNAAHVVAHVLIAYRAGVGAAPDGPTGQTGDTAYAGGSLLVGLGVDFASVGTVLHRAQVLPGNAAHVGHAGDSGGAGAGLDAAALAVQAHQAADIFLPGHGALGGTAADRAIIFAHQQARLTGGTLGSQVPFHGEVLHHGAGGQGTEQSGFGALLLKGKAGDGVAVAVEGALEDGHRSEVGAAQVQVGGELHGDTLGPGVPGTLFREVGKILDGGKGDRVRGRSGGQGQRTKERQYRQEGGSPLYLFHGVCSSSSEVSSS